MVDEQVEAVEIGGLVAPRIVGLTAGTQTLTKDKIFGEMMAEYDRLAGLRKQATNQRIEFDVSPVCLVHIADIHLGHPGVNVRRLLDETNLILSTPHMYISFLGDLVENQILAKLMHVRFGGEISPEREWFAVREYLKLAIPRAVSFVAGNHESWVMTLTGIPFFHEIVKQIKREALYSPYDSRCTISVRGHEFPMRARHKWRYKSKYNLTHGIEDACRFDHDFRIGVGAHYHEGAFARDFVVGGEDCLALICGSYKDIDEYQSSGGFPKHNHSTAASVILWEDGRMLGLKDLTIAAEIMRNAHK